MKFTHKIPTKPGFYWWTNFGEHTPTVLRVTKCYSNGKLYANDGEFSFEVKEEEFEKDEELKVDGHYYGESMWCEIPVPTLDGKEIGIDCY
jgi:hypothetical protein